MMDVKWAITLNVCVCVHEKKMKNEWNAYLRNKCVTMWKLFFKKNQSLWEVRLIEYTSDLYLYDTFYFSLVLFIYFLFRKKKTEFIDKILGRFSLERSQWSLFTYFDAWEEKKGKRKSMNLYGKHHQKLNDWLCFVSMFHLKYTHICLDQILSIQSSGRTWEKRIVYFVFLANICLNHVL